MAAWNWLDWTLAAIVLVSVVSAFRQGFMRELISLAAVIAGLVIAVCCYARAAVWFEDLTRSHQIALGVGFVVLFAGTLLVGAIISWLVGRMVKQSGFEWFDRLLGAGFGFVRGVVVNAVLLMAMLAFAIKPEVVQRAVLAPYMTAVTRSLVMVMPADLQTQFRSGFDKLRDALLQKPPAAASQNAQTSTGK